VAGRPQSLPLYYGDEVGLEGGKDPDNRRAMEWNEGRWNWELRAFIRSLLALRRISPALQTGTWHTEAADDLRGLCVFRRSRGREHAFLLLHTGCEHARVTLDLSALDLPAGFSATEQLSGVTLTPEGRALRLELPPLQGVLVTTVDPGTVR